MSDENSDSKFNLLYLLFFFSTLYLFLKFCYRLKIFHPLIHSVNNHGLIIGTIAEKH